MKKTVIAIATVVASRWVWAAKADAIFIWPSSFPPNEWFSSAAVAGHALTGEEQRKIDIGIRACLTKAAQANNTAEIELSKTHLKCMSYKDGGSTLFISNKQDLQEEDNSH